MKSSYDLTGMLYGETSASRVWLMSHAERSALLQVLRQAQPAGAIEVGTAGGGSLEQIRQHARLTVSIDILPEVKTQLAPVMPNVEFLTGDSKMLIPQALQLCAERQQPPGFALIDGDHTYRGVQGDLHALLHHHPTRPVWILIHDSANPECRAGITEARWADNPHVHLVDLDFVTGTLSQDPAFEGMLWGGLALALMLPEVRTDRLEIVASASLNQAALYRVSEHYPSLVNRLRRWVRTKRKGFERRLYRKA
ncbi:MAG: class I SAM-dependent methyltransferase [Opitutaceae bacterium]|jgi:hypothetical protein